MIRIALIEPEIPPNTGNIARLCAANRIPLHIVGVTGFRLDDKAVRRAGLDYWPEVILQRHPTLDNLRESLPEARFLYLTTKADKNYADWDFSPDDCLIFGRERADCPNKFCALIGTDASPFPCSIQTFAVSIWRPPSE